MASVNDIIADRLVAHQVRILRLASDTDNAFHQSLAELDQATFKLFGTAANDEGSIAHGYVDRLLAQCFKLNRNSFNGIYAALRSDLIDLAQYEVEFNIDLMRTHLPFRYSVKKPAKAFV